MLTSYCALKRFLLTGILTIILFYPLTASAERYAGEEQVDSMRALLSSQTGGEYQTTYDNILLILQEAEDIWLYRNELDALLLDAEKRGDVENQCAGRAYLATFYNNHGFIDSLIQVAPKLMKFVLQHDDWNAYSHIFNMYISQLTAAKRYTEAFDEINEIYAIAKEHKNQQGEGMALYWMGRINNNMHRFEEAVDNYKEALRVLKGSPRAGTRLNVYPSYAIALQNLNRYDDILELLHEFEKDIEQSDKEMEEKGLNQRFIGPAYKLYNEYVSLYIALNDLPKARLYYEKMKQSPMLKISPLNQYMLLEIYMRILEAEGNYSEALAVNDTVFQRRKELKDAGGMTNALHKRAFIARELGRADVVFDSFTRYNALNDSIKHIDINAKLDELRTHYEVDRHILEKERNRNYLILALAGCILLAVALALWIGYSRRLRAKNRALYEQIQARTQCRIAHEATLISRPQAELSNEMQLFRELSLVMKAERLFTDPDINRRTLAERLATNERYLAEAIHEGAGETFNNYINQQRLAYSLDLLISQPDLSIEAISMDAGFNSYPTFHRLFTRAYGMGPSEYRRMAGKK